MWKQLAVICMCVLSVRGAPKETIEVDKDKVTFIAIGDQGFVGIKEGDVGQEQASIGMNTWAGSHPPDFVLSLADQFYLYGIESATDPLIDTQWRNVYLGDDKPNIKDLKWYVAMGNHDYGWGKHEGWEANQLELAKNEPQYVLPAYYYTISITVKNNGDPFTVEIYVIDSESLIENKHDPDAMVTWLDTELGASTAEWTMIAAHHPAFSAASHGPVTGMIQEKIVPLVEKHKVNIYVSGHEHNLQHFVDADVPKTDYVLSGAGGAPLNKIDSQMAQYIQKAYNAELKFGTMVYGFAGFEVSKDSAKICFVESTGNQVYEFTNTRA